MNDPKELEKLAQAMRNSKDTPMTTTNKTVEERIEEIMESEPMKRVLGIEMTAIVTGRASQYYGKSINEVLKDALTQVREDTIREIVEKTNPPEKWKRCLKIAFGQDEICMTCGFSPNNWRKELLSLLPDNK